MASLVRSSPAVCKSLCRASLYKNTPIVTQIRQSRYAPGYMDPTLSDQNQVSKIPEDDPRRYQPIKAAEITHTTSLNHDDVIMKFTKMFIKEGNGERARRLMDHTLEHIKLIQVEKYHKAKSEEDKARVRLDARVILREAIENCKPLLIIQRVRRGGINYQVPIPAQPNYQRFRSMTWLIQAAKDKPRDMRFYEKLAHELIDAANNEGRAIKMKQDLHRLCEANRAYSHFRW